MSDMKFDADNKSIISTIQDSVKTEFIEVEPGQYTTREVYRVPDRPLSPVLGVSSLTGLVDYLNKNIDGNAREEMFVQVDSPTHVVAVNAIPDREERRFTAISAKADTPSLVFDKYLPKEEAIIMLQSRYVENDEQADLLMKLGNIVATEDLGQEDDGVTQNVTLQRGIKRVEEKIQNPVRLRPYRTFTEIDQPESPFIVRIRKSDHEGIQVAIFEADGGAWRNTARRSIKNYLESEIKDYPVIA